MYRCLGKLCCANFYQLLLDFPGFVEIEMMKERFAKLLLGEDMSGGGKGVSTALAISNAITNLSGQCIFKPLCLCVMPMSACDFCVLGILME